MKHLENKKDITKLTLLLFVIILTFNACEVGTPIRDAEYPEQVIYLPAAIDGPFAISNIARRIGDPPVPGNPYRYIVDLENNTFFVPLGVYRAGIDNVGAFSIDIEANNDTINNLIASGDTIITLLPSTHYTLDNSVEMPEGEEVAKFNLEIDLDFLRNSYPDSVYALGVSISSPDRDTNPELSTAVIVIYTSIMKPTADFSFSPDDTDPNTINFLNNSAMTVSSAWDFGDGSAVSEDMNPAHTYSGSGIYTVTLTSIGITGDDDKSTYSLEVTIP